MGSGCYTVGRRSEDLARPAMTVKSPFPRQAISKRLRKGGLGRPAGIVLPRPDSSVVERGPEKAGVGGSIPSLATTPFIDLA